MLRGAHVVTRLNLGGLGELMPMMSALILLDCLEEPVENLTDPEGSSQNSVSLKGQSILFSTV